MLIYYCGTKYVPNAIFHEVKNANGSDNSETISLITSIVLSWEKQNMCL